MPSRPPPVAASCRGTSRGTVNDQANTSTLAIAYAGIAQPMPATSKIQPSVRHPIAYVKLSQERIFP